MKASRPQLTRIKSRVLIALAAASVVTLLHLFAVTWRADAWIYDTLAPSPVADDRILVVAIDEKSLAELGRWPWSRRTHADLLARLDTAGVRGIAMDILLSEPALFDPEGDALLAQALNKSGKVVLPVYAEAERLNGPSVELMPIPEFAASAASLGHVDMALDSDGVARSMFLRAGLGSPHWPSLALALSQIGNDADPTPTAELPGRRDADLQQASPHRWVRDYQVLVPYINPPNGFQSVSYVDVVKGRVPGSLLRGRWVLVGVTAAGMGNELATPGWHATEPRLSGVDYQANALNMLIRHQAVVPLSMAAQVGLSILLVILPLLLFGVPGLHQLWRPILLGLVGVPLLSWLLLRFGQVWYPPMSALLVLGVGALMRILRMVRRTRQQAQSDPLTGLANRVKFDEYLEQELRFSRRSGQPLSLLLLDVDHFKKLNDGLGHPAGDEVLRELSTILRGRARRPRDLVARLGGDEFALLLPETTPQAAAAIATTIHVDVANLSSRSGNHVPLPPFTASIGIHTSQREEETAADVFELADNALYKAKQAGRNRSFSHTGERGFAQG